MKLVAMIHAPAAQEAKKPTGVKIAIATMIPAHPSHGDSRWLRSAISEPARTSADSPAVNSTNGVGVERVQRPCSR